MKALVTWLLLAMASWAPVQKTSGVETLAEATIRRESIVKDLLEVTFDSKEKPLFMGDNGRAYTAIWIANWLYDESNYAVLVDQGKVRGDGGRSWCLGQHNIGEGRTPSWYYKEYRFALPTDAPGDVTPGFTGPELVKDRKNCLRATLHAFHHSLQRCSKYTPVPEPEKLNPDVFSLYAAGYCVKGLPTIQKRQKRLLNFLKLNAVPADKK